MEAVTLNKADVLQALETNRTKREAVHLAALEGWRKEAEEKLVLSLEGLRNGLTADINLSVPMPRSHLAEYDRAITMLKMDINDTVVFEEHEFERYILDNWEWKRASNASSRALASAAFTANYGDS